MTAPGLEAEVELTLGPLVLAVGLSVAPGETVAVLGPNGAGKTTLLRALAGLVALDRGRVVLDGEVLEAAPAGPWVPPERRPVAMVFQNHLLFPHLSALANVAFGLRAGGMRRAEADRRARQWLDGVGLADRGTARPAQLSGGEAQRVALARALAVEARLLLLDEPLAALDATTRAATRRNLRRHLAGYRGARVLVTHDPVEAMVLADRLVVLEAGRVVQEGSLADLTGRPRSPYVADLVGVNLFRGRAQGDRVALAGPAELVVASAVADGPVLAVVHPRSVALYRSAPEGSARNVWAGRVEGVDPEGARARVRVGGCLPIVAEVTAAAVADLGLAEGTPVWVSVKATEVDVYAE